MGLYITKDDVIIRVQGKVKFSEDGSDENKMSFALLDRLIAEAEGDVEYDLSPRYASPFTASLPDGSTAPFKVLPDRPTRNILRTLCELKAVCRVLETDFGRGTVVEADKYAKPLNDRYLYMIGKQLEKKKQGGEESGWKYPPLPGLTFNYMNTESDDGYAGMLLSTSRGVGDFPAGRINNPAESWWNAQVDPEDTSNPNDRTNLP